MPSACCCSTRRAFSCSMPSCACRAYLPLNPQGFGGLAPDLAFNTAVSFTTNTNWQNYVGEATMSYFTQMAGLTVHNFVSAATGIALAIALIRGFARASAPRASAISGSISPAATLYVLLPICDRDRAVPGRGRACRRTSIPTSTATTLDGAPADHRAGTGRLADRDQDARHQRRRLLQRQLPRIRSRTRPRSPTSCRWWRSSPSARR